MKVFVPRKLERLNLAKSHIAVPNLDPLKRGIFERECAIQSNGLNTAMSLKRPIRRFPRCHFHNSTNTSNKSWMSECTIELALSRRQFLYLQLITVQLPLIFELSNSPCGYYHLPTKLGKVLFSVLYVCSQWGTEGIHLTITHDALGPTVLPSPRYGASLYMTHLKMGPHC